MKKLVFGVALAALMSAGPALAADKKAKAEGSTAGSSQTAEAGRGGLSEWPVSKEEADWKSAAPASTGASSGTSGSDADDAAGAAKN
jgi:hypothetical protein